MDTMNRRPTGELQGDDRAIPMRGTREGATDTYGADITQDATNSLGRITSDTKSDPADMCLPDNPVGL